MNPLVLLIAFGVFMAIAGKGAVDVVRQARGIRNHNPGNLRRSGDAWQGLSPVQDDPEFFQFTSPHWGIRAMARTLRNYKRRHGINTLAGMISRYAPASENPTANYVAAVAQRAGIPFDAVINLDDDATLVRLIPAMIHFENGSNPYGQSQIVNAVAASA